MANKNINVGELDFDGIKQNLKEFLQGQSQFSDYDFDGSSLSILLDILAYNTHYNALYKNLAVNESFLESASKRNNVVSRAKGLGYIPNSAKCPSATIDIRISGTSSTPSVLTLPRYSAFTTLIDGETYLFYTMEDMTTTYSNNQYLFQNVTILEGNPLSYTYQVADGVRYYIPNPDVDLSTLVVNVKENATTLSYTSFQLASDFLVLDSTSNVYFIKEIEDELYEIEFGDGVLGSKLSNGNVVTIEYMTTNKTAANSAKVFSYQGSSILGGTVTITTKTAAAGGTDIEDIESIRFNAPKYYASQNRGVVVDDYVALIKKNYTNVDSVSVWGGEDNDPPIYGKVFICIKPSASTKLTDKEKNLIIKDVIDKKNVIVVIPEIVDPEYIKVEVTTSVYYNPKATSRSASDISTLVKQSIADYNDTDLNKFDKMLRFSKLSRIIDQSEESIVNNITTIKLHRPFEAAYNVYSQYVINLGNPIYYSGYAEQSIQSSSFYIYGNDNPHYLEDDGVGNIRLYYLAENNLKVYTNNNIGTVNYTSGKVVINNLNITRLNEPELKLIFKPQSNDVVSLRQQLVIIPDDYIIVDSIVDPLSVGGMGKDYIFTSSRT